MCIVNFFQFGFFKRKHLEALESRKKYQEKEAKSDKKTSIEEENEKEAANGTNDTGTEKVSEDQGELEKMLPEIKNFS